MGNHASCILRSTRPHTAKLVDAEGNLRRVDIPAVTAELMLEAPGHVVARAEEVVRTRLVSGLRAHEELRPGEVYLLLPMERVGSRLSDRQMVVVVGALEGGRRRRRRKGNKSCGSGSRVFPEVAGREEGFLEGKVPDFPVRGFVVTGSTGDPCLTLSTSVIRVSVLDFLASTVAPSHVKIVAYGIMS